MGTLIFLAVVAAIATAIWGIHTYTKNKDIKDLQKSTDESVERQLMDGLEDLTITALAKHSDKRWIASIVSARIADYLKMGVDPTKFFKLLENLKLNPTVRENWNEKEVELSALIQQYVLQNQDQEDLKLWNKTVLGDKKSGLENMQTSFLVKAKKSPWILDLNLS